MGGCAKLGRLREAVIYNNSSSILLTVWGDLLDSIEECKTHEFHSLALKNFFGLKLSATTPTIITDQVIPNLYESDLKEHLDHEKMINDKLHPKVWGRLHQHELYESAPNCPR